MIPNLIDTTQKKLQRLPNAQIFIFRNDNPGFIPDKKLDSFIKGEIKKKKELVLLRNSESLQLFLIIDKDKSLNDQNEKARKLGSMAFDQLKTAGFETVYLHAESDVLLLALTEGLVLRSYVFNKYKSDRKAFQIKDIIAKFNGEADELKNVLSAVYWSRDLVNEPPDHLSAIELSERFKSMGKTAEISVEVMEKLQLESLRMGGVLAVNRGSIEEPTFSILSWKPKNAKNKKPFVLVGKGVVYDTGGINLKPTGFLETMKSDMSGSAVVAGVMKALAENKIPAYVLAIIPATDNRPGQNAIVPGDIITMYNGATVEIINTDAEGRLILADGLAFSEKFKPQLVFSVATLTGSASRTFGSNVIAGMGNAKQHLDTLKKCGFEVGEKIAELPFWDEYGEELKSDFADLKNLGGTSAGAISAGKFLEKFVKSPYIHLDIAGVSFLEKDDYYRKSGGTGTGIRLLYDFIKTLIDL